MSTITWPARAGTATRASTPRGTMRDRQPAGSSLSALYVALTDGLSNWQTRRAEPYVNALLARNSDERLLELGYSRTEIAHIRSTSHGAPCAWM